MAATAIDATNAAIVTFVCTPESLWDPQRCKWREPAHGNIVTPGGCRREMTYLLWESSSIVGRTLLNAHDP